MRRALTVFLLLILPLQLSWAAVAVYCQHEQSTQQATGHMGHHEHRHSPRADKVTGEHAKKHGSEKQDGKTPCVNDDCAYCQLASLKTVGMPTIVFELNAESIVAGQAPLMIESHISARLERPNWRAV